MFEFFGDSRQVHHQGVFNWINSMSNPQQKEHWEVAYTSSQEMSLAFHTYVAEWEPNFITFYTDGVQKARFPIFINQSGQSVNTCNPATGLYYNHSAYPTYGHFAEVILSVSADWTPDPNRNPNNTTPFPGTMEVDYVRVYQRVPQAGLSDLCSGTITGNTTICATNQQTYSLSTPVGRAANTWSVSSNLQIISSTSNSITVKALTTNTNGAAWIQANLTTYTPCTQNTLVKNIWIGKPNQPTASIYTQNCEAGFDIVACCNVLSSPSFTWVVAGTNVSGANIQGTNPSSTCNFISYNTPTYNYSKTYSVTAINQCGSILKSGIVTGPGCNGQYRLSVTPNPANEEISITVDEDLFVSGSNIWILSQERGLIKETMMGSNTITENVSNFDNGLYYVVYPYENEEYLSKSFIIQH